MAAVTDWVRSMVGLGEQIKTAAGSILPRTSQDKTPPYLPNVGRLISEFCAR